LSRSDVEYRESNSLPSESADEVLRQLGAVLGPVGFHDAQVALVQRQQEAVLLPEVAHRVPQLVGGPLDDQPALAASPLDADVRHVR
jgi:hypothetical protein